MKGPLAYAHARVLARKAQLLGTREAALLLASSHPPTALAALGGDPFDKLLRIYDLCLRTYRAPIFRALLTLHEIENVKLLWRVGANDRDRAAIRRLWLPLGALATVEMPRDVLSLRDVVEHLAKTPYGEIAKNVLRSGAGETAFDRWARQRLLDEAKRLPKSEALTRAMIETGRVHRRAFVVSPFRLAPAVAVVLLAEAEVRAVRAIVERAAILAEEPSPRWRGEGAASAADEGRHPADIGPSPGASPWPLEIDNIVMRVVAQSQMGGA